MLCVLCTFNQTFEDHRQGTASVNVKDGTQFHFAHSFHHSLNFLLHVMGVSEPAENVVAPKWVRFLGGSNFVLGSAEEEGKDSDDSTDLTTIETPVTQRLRAAGVLGSAPSASNSTSAQQRSACPE